MTRLAAIVGTVLLGLVVMGCEKKSPPPERSAYNPKIDVPPNPLAVSEDRGILADQGKVSTANETKGTAPAPSGTPAPTGGPTSGPAATSAPSGAPTVAPTAAPTSAPSGAPTAAPTPVGPAPGPGPAVTPTAAPKPIGPVPPGPPATPAPTPAATPTAAATPAPTAAPAPTAGATSAPAAGPITLDAVAIDSIKAVVGKMTQCGAPGMEGRMAAYFDGKDAEVLKADADAGKSYRDKAVALDKLLQDNKLALPAIKTALKKAEDETYIFGPTFLSTKPTDLKVQKIGEEVFVTSPTLKTSKIKVVKVGDEWKAALMPADQNFVAAVPEFMQACEKLIDTLKAGIDDKTITKANIAAKFDELVKQVLDPADKKLQASRK